MIGSHLVGRQLEAGHDLMAADERVWAIAVVLVVMRGSALLEVEDCPHGKRGGMPTEVLKPSRR